MTPKDEFERLAREYGPEVARQALPLLRRMFDVIKRGHGRKITAALDRADATIDEALEARIRRDQGEGHT